GTCSTQLLPYQRIEIIGTTGRLAIEIPFNAPRDRPCRITLDTIGDLAGRGVEQIDFDACDQYTIQAEEFSRALVEHRPQVVPLEDAVANMECIDAIFRSSKSGRWERPSVRG
ncbi:MAG TPA: Gfo/Idh/MocA family oxidoreductase, partial [Vicinamibacterales bacterium]|nr:Gfo/Idh/MocA family oxidoreductase [Vicinamibacterales bacterium]